MRMFPDGIAGSVCAKAQVDAKRLDTSMSSEDIALHRRREILILNCIRSSPLDSLAFVHFGAVVPGARPGAHSSATRVVIWRFWCQDKSGDPERVVRSPDGHRIELMEPTVS